MEKVDPLMVVPPPQQFMDKPMEQQVVPQPNLETPVAFQQTMDISPPEGYEQAFNAPMSMSEALAATEAAMNPSMTAPSEDSDTSTGTPGTQGEAPGFGLGPGGEDGGEDGGTDGGPSGSPGTSGGPGGIGSEGGGGGPSGSGPAGGPGDAGNDG